MPASRDLPLGLVWQMTIADKERAREQEDRDRRRHAAEERAEVVRRNVQHRFTSSQLDNEQWSSSTTARPTHRDSESAELERGMQELDIVSPVHGPTPPPTSSQTASSVELPASDGAEVQLSSRMEDLTTAELEANICVQQARNVEVEVELEDRIEEVRRLLVHKEDTEQAHLQAVLAQQQAEIDRLNKTLVTVVEKLNLARANVKSLTAEIDEGRTREAALRQEMRDREAVLREQMHERESCLKEQMRNQEQAWEQQRLEARLHQMQADADFEASRIASRVSTRTSPPTNASSGLPSGSSRRGSSTRSGNSKMVLSVPKGNRNAPIEIFKHMLR